MWFHKAKIGLLMHFGLYSLLGGEWKGQRMDYIGEWIQSRFNIPMKDGKEDYLKPWTFTSSDSRFEMDFVPIIDYGGVQYLFDTRRSDCEFLDS